LERDRDAPPFSQADSAAACSSLSETAHLLVTKVQQLQPSVKGELQRRQLSALLSRLQQFGLHATQLGQYVSDPPAVSKQLGQILDSHLAECQSTLNTISEGLEPGSDGADDLNALACYLTFATASVSLFSLTAQLLTTETEREQDSTLANPGAAVIVDAAHKAAERVLSLNYQIN